MKLKHHLSRATAVPRHLAGLARYRLWPSEPAPTRFVIFGEGRCGSTVLVSRLDSLEGVRCEDEILRFRVPFPLEHVLSRCAASTDAVYGCKVLTFQIRELQPLSRPEAFLGQLHAHGFRIVHLRRENLVQHAVSNLRARQLGFHVKRDSPEPAPAKIIVNMAELLEWIDRAREMYRYEDQLLGGFPRLELTYEQHLATEERQLSVMADLCDFLDIPFAPGRCEWRKASPRRLRDSVANHDEFCRAVKQAGLGRFLDEEDR
jgi:LPS sulfotransferase NodH